MTKDEKNQKISRYGINCPVCGMHLIDLAHDGFESGDPDYHDFYCTECNIDFTITVE